MTKIRLQRFSPFAILLVLLMLVSVSLTPAHAQTMTQRATQPVAKANGQDAVAVTSTDNVLTITWPNPAFARAATADLLQQLPTVRFQGYLLPMQLLTIEIEEGETLDLQFSEVRTQPWPQTIQPAAPLAPSAIDWESLADPTRPVETVALPAAPLFVLRKGNFYGKQIAVVALSPLYAEAGATKVATALSAQAAGARLADTAQLQSTEQIPAQSFRHLRSAQVKSALAPVNPDATRNAFKVVVNEVGMQQITGQQLANAGFNLAQVDPARLQLRHKGEEVALQLDGLAAGKLTPTSTARFYTFAVGDRWNPQEMYWLTEGESAGLRMGTRAVTPLDAPMRSTAVERGVWEEYQLYDSRYEGADGDHWFHQKLVPTPSGAAVYRTERNEPLVDASEFNAASVDDTVAVTLISQLPRVAETAIYTVSITTNARGQHALRVKIGDENRDITWSSVLANELVRDWQHVISSTVQSNILDVSLLSTATTDKDATVLLDKISWQAPVLLDFGGKGAAFRGVAGTWRYQWTNLPAAYTLYDVTEKRTPTLLTGTDASGFQDGPTPRTYLLTAPGTLHTPTVVAHTPIALTTIGGADAIYIGPAQFLAELTPLLQLRRDQGYQVITVDVQAIYDGWSFGQVSAEAIRTFLRYAAANWQPAPRAVTLVGDATWDPHNYEKRDNLNFVPPYLAKADPWLIEAACEPCYAQLDGDDPLTGDDPAGHLFVADLWIGRLPVKNSGELAALVNKIVGYERTTTLQAWQNVNVFVADNYIKSVDSNGALVRDLAGDFARISDGVVALAPAAVRNQRVYYDPYPQLSDPDRLESWRIEDALRARDEVLAQLSAGAGLVTYNGHSHHWQWAITDESPNADPNWLLGLYDTDTLTNKDRYFVSLSMTCLTAQFHKPAFSGTVLDERMLLNANGGSVATWGPAGLSVAYGHDLLQRGFYRALWAAPPFTAKIGALIEAGNTELITQGACCQDTLKTFLLLGDPLMTVRAYPNEIPQIYLPFVQR